MNRDLIIELILLLATTSAVAHAKDKYITIEIVETIESACCRQIHPRQLIQQK